MENDNQSFSFFSLQKQFIDNLDKQGIVKPTAVQEKVIPAILEGKNVFFESETGTGKTFAYLLPLLEKVSFANKDVQVIIVSPTHELASQIKGQIQILGDFLVNLCIGGTSLKRQIEFLKEKPQVVIGTPGRILELIHLKKLKLAGLQAIVFDEIDRLMAKELRDDTMLLASLTPSESQLIACSATMKENLSEKIALSAKKEIESIYIEPEDILQKNIEHIALFSEQRNKVDVLRSFLAAVKPKKTLVFTSKLSDVQIIASKLAARKIASASLFASASMKERKAAIDGFRSGKIQVLVTSDLSSRGLDIQDVSHVVQMDYPSNEVFFIHRAGRTGRSGNMGYNVLIGDAWEMREFAKLEKKLGIKITPKQLSSGKLLAPKL